MNDPYNSYSETTVKCSCGCMKFYADKTHDDAIILTCVFCGNIIRIFPNNKEKYEVENTNTSLRPFLCEISAHTKKENEK